MLGKALEYKAAGSGTWHGALGSGLTCCHLPRRNYKQVYKSIYSLLIYRLRLTPVSSIGIISMDIEVIRRIMLARHLYSLASSYLKSNNDLYHFSAINLMQDAVEAFLLGVADHVEAQLNEKTNFDKYFVEINNKITPKELPFKTKLLRLNRIRVDSKHHGIQPAKVECERLFITTREFFDEVCSNILDVNFSTVSTIDLLKDGEVKDILIKAKWFLEAGDFAGCSIACRKALYLEIEKQYDIGTFKKGAANNALRGFLGFQSNAPHYACNEEYIREKVGDPTDLIVIDHSHLEHELLKYGVDDTSFWNVWRLTPEVYQNEDKSWVIKNDFSLLEHDVLKDEIEYIFSTTIDIIFSIHSKRATTRFKSYGNYHINLKDEEIPVYTKADKTSEVNATIPRETTKVDCNYSIEGLNNDGVYWHVIDFRKDVSFYGFVHDDYVKR